MISIKKNKLLFLILTIGLVIRIVLNNIIYSKDAESFVFWGKYLQDHSIANLFKFLPILSELVIAILIYWFVSKYLNKKWAIPPVAFYFLHPAIIYNTAVFGQIDSFVASLAFIAVMLIVIKKYALALSIYTFGVLSKLQDLAILPLIVISTLGN